MRSFADDRGMSIEEFAAYCKDHPHEDYDKRCDEIIRSFGLQNFVFIEGRLPHVLAPHAFHVLLVCEDLDVLARRRFNDIKKKAVAKNRSYPKLSEVRKKIEQRDKDDNERYEKLYPGCLWSEDDYDCVIDTSYMKPRAVIGKIVALRTLWLREKGDKIIREVSLR